MNWFHRWRKRQDQLASGVDADLVRDNQKRYRLGLGLLGFGFAVGLLVSKVHLPNGLRLVLIVVSTVFVLAGFIAGAWASQEAGFLSKPDPEEPPKIFR
jgi:hypothetical protein